MHKRFKNFSFMAKFVKDWTDMIGEAIEELFPFSCGVSLLQLLYAKLNESTFLMIQGFHED